MRMEYDVCNLFFIFGSFLVVVLFIIFHEPSLPFFNSISVLYKYDFYLIEDVS